nr:arabinofuranosidase catalytic domain-containing protein [uncultured Roseovarius sp.]
MADNRITLPSSVRVALSVARALDTGYSGSLIRVRRSSDDAEADIGIDSDGNLDQTSLLAHTGTGTGDHGYLVKVYEQSGTSGSFDFEQTIESRQPIIVQDGEVVTANGQPTAIQPVSGSDTRHMVSASAWTGRPSDGAVCMVASALTTGRASIFTMLNGGDNVVGRGYLGAGQPGGSSKVVTQDAGTPTYYADGALIGTQGSIDRDDIFTSYSNKGLTLCRFEDADFSDSKWESVSTDYVGSAAVDGLYELSEIVIFDNTGVGAGDVATVEANQDTVFFGGGGGSDDLTPSSIEATSEVGSPTLGQTHVLTASGIEATSEVGSPTLGQTHALTPSSIEATSEVGAPTLSTGAVLTPLSIEAASEVGSPAIGQTHALTPASIEAASEVGAPTLSTGAILVPSSIEATSEVGSPTLGQTHALTPAGISAASEVGSPSMGQTHALAPSDIEAASEVGAPTLSTGILLSPSDIEATSEVGAPSIGQTHILAPSAIEAASEVGAPSIGQTHVLTPASIEAASEVGSPTLSEPGDYDPPLAPWLITIAAEDRVITVAAENRILTIGVLEMAGSWPPKDPRTSAKFGFDWSAYLGTDTINTSVWTAEGVNLTDDEKDTAITSVRISDGTARTEYTVRNTITTSGGDTFSRSALLEVKNR